MDIDTIIEVIGCVIQFFVLAVLVIWPLQQKQDRTLFRCIAAAFGCYFLGNLYWLLSILVTGDWPMGFSPSDIGFVAYYCFFLTAALLLRERWTDEQRALAKKYRIIALLGPVVVIGYTISYNVLWGQTFTDRRGRQRILCR